MSCQPDVQNLFFGSTSSAAARTDRIRGDLRKLRGEKRRQALLDEMSKIDRRAVAGIRDESRWA